MAVAFDTSGQNGNSGSTTLTGVAITIGANANRVLVVFVMVKSGSAPSSVTVDLSGTNVPAVAGGPFVDGTGFYRIYAFSLIAPGTGAKNLNVTVSGVTPTTLVCGGFSFYNADQSTGVSNLTSNTGSSTTASVAVTTSSGNAVAAVAADNNGTSTPTVSGATSDFEQRAFDGNYHGAHQLSTGATETPTWTGINASAVDWVAAGINVIAAAGAGNLSASPGEPNIYTGVISA